MAPPNIMVVPVAMASNPLIWNKPVVPEVVRIDIENGALGAQLNEYSTGIVIVSITSLLTLLESYIDIGNCNGNPVKLPAGQPGIVYYCLTDNISHFIYRNFAGIVRCRYLYMIAVE